MTDRELMQMALDKLDVLEDYDPNRDTLIKALRDRLAQPEMIPISNGGVATLTPSEEFFGEPEPVIGTKTWFEDGKVVTQHLHPSDIYKDPRNTAPVHAIDISQERVDETAKCGHEPVAYVSGYHDGYCVVTPINPATVFSVGTAFSYTAPPKREWVGLTDEEIFDIADKFGSFQYGDAQGHKRLDYAKAIEAKLKEKNT